MQSSEADELVLDPFFGSAPTILASRRLGRAAWGTDIARRAHEAAAERLTAEGYDDASLSPAQPSPVPAGLSGTCPRGWWRRLAQRVTVHPEWNDETEDVPVWCTRCAQRENSSY